jgi:hypothetical protein
MRHITHALGVAWRMYTYETAYAKTEDPDNLLSLYHLQSLHLFAKATSHSLWADERHTPRFPQACFLPPSGERITCIIHIIWSKNNFSTGRWSYCSQVTGKTNSKCYHPPCHAKMSYCKPPTLSNDVLRLQFYNCYHSIILKLCIELHSLESMVCERTVVAKITSIYFLQVWSHMLHSS